MQPRRRQDAEMNTVLCNTRQSDRQSPATCSTRAVPIPVIQHARELCVCNMPRWVRSTRQLGARSGRTEGNVDLPRSGLVLRNVPPMISNWKDRTSVYCYFMSLVAGRDELSRRADQFIGSVVWGGGRWPPRVIVKLNATSEQHPRGTGARESHSGQRTLWHPGRRRCARQCQAPECTFLRGHYTVQ